MEARTAFLLARRGATGPSSSFNIREMKSRVIVAIVWAALLAAALGLVRTYGTRTFPQADELWALYDAGPGIHAQWLWTTWAEHRIPLALLNFGQAQVFLWWWQINHVLAPILAGLTLILVVLRGNNLQLRHGALV